MFRGKSHHFPTAFAAEAMDFAAEILSGEVVPEPSRPSGTDSRLEAAAGAATLSQILTNNLKDVPKPIGCADGAAKQIHTQVI